MHTVFKALLAGCLSISAGQTLAMTVFACEPEWAALVRTLVPLANVRTATTHLQDPHYVEAKPSLIAKMRDADFAICTGAQLEEGWLPTLQDRASNPKVQNGQRTMFYAAQHVDLIDLFKGTITPFSGDVHAQGNPHIHLDPARMLKVAKALTTRIAEVFPDKKDTVQANLKIFEAELSAKMEGWKRQTQHLKGQGVLTQHTSFGYLWQWLGLEVIADLEPKPGVPPTAAHLEKVLAESQKRAPLAIIVSQHHDPRPGQWMAKNLGIQHRLFILPATVPDELPNGLIRWYDSIVSKLVALPGQGKP